jgi:hypothetical protein
MRYCSVGRYWWRIKYSVQFYTDRCIGSGHCIVVLSSGDQKQK